MPEDKEFIPGLYVKEPNQEWLKAKISIKVADLKNYLENNSKEEWINIDVKTSKDGKWYAQRNNWKPNTDEEIPN